MNALGVTTVQDATGAVDGIKNGRFGFHVAVGEEPVLTNVLEDFTVEDGRLKGRRLQSGSFLSPELSYDGKTILFAYSENREAMQSWDEIWPPSKSSRK